MAKIYSLYNPRTSNHRDFTDAKEAGAAFFNEERADQPSVDLLQADPKAPGGRFFRPMASTSIYGTYANGEKKFVKQLPDSHEGDDKFREGYMEALEKSVKERLKQTDWEKARPDHPMKAPNLDNKLYDDLDILARVDDNKAIKAWKDNAPEWATPPAYADPAWNKEIAQAKRAAEFDAAQRERKQAEFERMLPDDPTEKNVVSHEPEKLEEINVDEALARVARMREVEKQQRLAAEQNLSKHEPEKLEEINVDEALARMARMREVEKQQRLAAEQNKLGQQAEGKRIKVENLSEKAQEQDDANRIAERTGANTAYPEQVLTEREKNRQVELMQQVHQQFRVSGAKFHFKDQPQRVAFKDKGPRMVSALNDERVAHAMATMAEAKGWKTIRVSGHPDFQREVWMEANLRGIEVRGFKPQEKDLKELEARRDLRSKNVVEHEATQTRQGAQQDTGKAPERSDKAKVVAAVAAEVLAEKIKNPRQREAIMKAINERLEQREKSGKVPSVPVYDKAAPSTQQQPERIRPQVERNTERTR